MVFYAQSASALISGRYTFWERRKWRERGDGREKDREGERRRKKWGEKGVSDEIKRLID